MNKRAHKHAKEDMRVRMIHAESLAKKESLATVCVFTFCILYISLHFNRTVTCSQEGLVCTYQLVKCGFSLITDAIFLITIRMYTKHSVLFLLLPSLKSTILMMYLTEPHEQLNVGARY